MAHEVGLRIKKKIAIGNVDIAIEVKKDGELLGMLTISQGSIDWRPEGKRKGGKDEVRLSWTEFDSRIRSGKRKKQK